MTDRPASPEPNQLRVSDQDRERVAKTLNDAMATGRLTVDELEERLDKVYTAKTFGDLEPLTGDLPTGKGTPPAPARESTAAVSGNDRIGGRGTSSSAVAIVFGGERSGPWVVPPDFKAVAVIGGINIDLSDARFEERETTIRVTAVLGGVNITVPDDVTVVVNGAGFLGGFSNRVPRREVSPDGPLVRITGIAVLGGVDVQRS